SFSRDWSSDVCSSDLKQVGQTVVVENKGGASGFIAAQDIARAKPDGYRIFVTSNTTHASNSALFKKLPYDPVKDFAPISKLGNIDRKSIEKGKHKSRS